MGLLLRPPLRARCCGGARRRRGALGSSVLVLGAQPSRGASFCRCREGNPPPVAHRSQNVLRHCPCRQVFVTCCSWHQWHALVSWRRAAGSALSKNLAFLHLWFILHGWPSGPASCRVPACGQGRGCEPQA